MDVSVIEANSSSPDGEFHGGNDDHKVVMVAGLDSMVVLGER